MYKKNFKNAHSKLPNIVVIITRNFKLTQCRLHRTKRIFSTIQSMKAFLSLIKWQDVKEIPKDDLTSRTSAIVTWLNSVLTPVILVIYSVILTIRSIFIPASPLSFWSSTQSSSPSGQYSSLHHHCHSCHLLSHPHHKVNIHPCTTPVILVIYSVILTIRSIFIPASTSNTLSSLPSG